MRIIAGTWRGRRLAQLGKGDAAAHLRPTSDRVRESLFSLLMHRLDFDGIRVLDLFAGTGALGLEALSRGAAEAVFVESGRVGQRLITENIVGLGAEATTLLRNDATRLGPWPHAPFDLVFLDPPYGKGLGQLAVKAIQNGGWLADDALIVWEDSVAIEPPDGFELVDGRRYGDTHVTLMQPVAAS